MNTSTNTKNFSEDWAPARGWKSADPETPKDYLGGYLARSDIKKGGGATWAGITPLWKVGERQRSVGELEAGDLLVDKVIEIAREMDADIDGHSISSIVKEGEEKFIYGAVYSGLQGVSVSDSSGLVAAYTRGAKVDWVKGNKWTYQEDGWVVSEVKVTSSKSTTTVDDEYKVEINAGSSAVSNSAQKDYSSLISAGCDLDRKSTAGAGIFTANTAGAGIFTANTAGAGIFAANTAGAGIFAVSTASMMSANNLALFGISNHNFTVGILNTLNCSVMAINVTNIASALYLTTTKAKTKITRDFTDLSMTLSANNFFNVAKNSMTAFNTAARTAKVLVASAEFDMSRVEQLISSNKVSFTDSAMRLNRADMDLNKAKLAEIENEIKINKTGVENNIVLTEVSKKGASINTGDVTIVS